MLAAMEEAGLADDDAVLAESIRRYWLHFFGFFELTATQRRELRALALRQGAGALVTTRV